MMETQTSSRRIMPGRDKGSKLNRFPQVSVNGNLKCVSHFDQLTEWKFLASAATEKRAVLGAEAMARKHILDGLERYAAVVCRKAEGGYTNFSMEPEDAGHSLYRFRIT
jgi:hypothetical protein